MTSNDLIQKIERKDRLFRYTQVLFMLLTLVALFMVIFAQQRTLDGIKKELDQQKSTAQAESDHLDANQANIQRRLDCIVAFFGHKDRTSLSISDIDKCTINKDDDVQQFFSVSPSVSSTPSTPEQKTTTPPAQNTPQQQSQTQTPDTTPPPQKLLGVPLCVPLTGVCVRQ